MSETDHYTPGKLVPHKWHKYMTINKYLWGFQANAGLADTDTTEGLLNQLITTVSHVGNIPINVALTAYGENAPIFLGKIVSHWIMVESEWRDN